jgi:cystathionine beta-lyase/cystathionine gamma-synthase
MRDSTLAIHAADCHDATGPVMKPIYLSSTYKWESFEQEPEDWVYSRVGHPNRGELEQTVAALEGAKYATGFGSGMAGISAAMEIAEAGDHVLIAEDIYGGTFNLSKSFMPRHGIEVSYFDSLLPNSVAESARPNTKLLVFESPTNPTLEVCDMAAVVAEAKKLGITTVFDNTFATPILQKPLEFGVDVVCHSTTKYMGGHSDVVGGVVATNDAAIHELLFSASATIGAVPGPFDAWLVARGLKTLYPRMMMHCDNAMQVAEFLSKHPKVAKVNYPGLPCSPGHELAKKQMKKFGAMLSFEIAGTAYEAMIFGKKCKLFKMAGSLGGVESLLSYPTKMSHIGMTEEERIARGIPPTLVRVSIGLEHPDDLCEDLDQALRSV